MKRDLIAQRPYLSTLCGGRTGVTLSTLRISGMVPEKGRIVMIKKDRSGVINPTATRQTKAALRQRDERKGYVYQEQETVCSKEAEESREGCDG